MSLLVKVQPMRSFADRPRKEASYTGSAWIGDVLPLGEDMFGRYPLLSCVDPYGQTIFNSLQVPFVIAELERRRGEMAARDAVDLSFVEELILVARECHGTHEALVFVGD